MDFTGFPPANKGFDGNISDLLDRVSRVERRRPPRDTGRGTTRTAFLDPDYRGWGPAALVIDGVLSTEFYNWTVPYVPNGSRMVRIMWTGLTWEIVGQVSDETIMLPYDETKMDIYGERAGDNFWNLRPRATKLALSGLVVLSGMMMGVGSPGSATVIAVLPEGMRPSQHLIFPIEYGDFARSIYINPNGNVTLGGAAPAANAYISLDGIAFHPAGVGEWVTVGDEGSAFGANFEEWTDPQYGPCAFYKDPWGFVWWRGLARIKATVTVDNTPIVTVAAPYRPDREEHFRSTANEVYAGIGSQPANGLNWKGGTIGSVGAWISLTGATFVTTDGINQNPWKNIKTFNNGWAKYPSVQFPDPGYLRREDGLCVTKGLMNSGTINAKMAGMTQEEMWPAGGKIILAAICSSARARLDVNAARELEPATGPGALIGRGASNAWFSWDGLKWVP